MLDKHAAIYMVPPSLGTPMPHRKFHLHLRDLPCDKHVDVDNAYVAGILKGHPLREALDASDTSEAGAGELEVSAYGDETTVFVSGRIHGWLYVACGRCLGPAKIAFDEQLRVTFVPQQQLEEDSAKAVADADEEPAKAAPEAKSASKEAAEDDGPEVEEGDLDLFGYIGEIIDLEPVVREQFVLAIPYAPLCKEACKGLCSQCGADLNVAACSCPPIVDGRWEALGKMKLPS